MIVDDESFNLIVLEKLLVGIDKEIEITQAVDGKYAIDYFKEKIQSNKCQFCEYFKFILMDLNMPITDGGKAAEEILRISKQIAEERKIHPEPVKIIGLSAYTDLASKNYCLESGMVRYMNKPIRKIDLIKNLVEVNCLTSKNRNIIIT